MRDDGAVVDRFRNRLMVPIARDAGSIIAFGGRALEPDQMPKYLNSPETPIYTKSRILYGLNLTKGDLRKTEFAIVVEGYFDFAQLYQAGGLPVVATCGTALTTAAGADAAPLRAQGGHQLRPRHGRPERRRAIERAAGRSRASTSTWCGCPAATTPTPSCRSTDATPTWRS